MVAIFTGAGAGFARGSADLLGGAGQLDNGTLGRGGENVAVNAATGNLLVSQQDEFLVGRGPDIGIARTYNSLEDVADGDNGDHWQQSTTRRVFGLTGTLDTAGSTISRLGADGAVIAYSWDAGESAYVGTGGAGAHDRLTHSAGVWTWTDGDSQASETYEAHGTDNWRVVSASDIDGNSLSFTYAGDRLDNVTTADGAWTQYVWSGNNIAEISTGYTDLATSTAETLTRTRYSYDASDRLVLVTTDLSPGDNAIADGDTYTVSYTYDGASNRIASIGQTDGSLLTIAYDASGRVETLTQTVAGGDTRVTGLVYGSGYTEVTAPDGQLTRLDYDTAGQLTKITAPPAHAGAAAQEVQFAYDTEGNLVSVTDGNGHVTAYDHDANGNVTQVTDANGNTVERSYDSGNRLLTELSYGSDTSGASAAHYAQYAYDAEGHLRFAVNGAGQVTEYEYTAAGELARRIEYAEHPYPVGPAQIDEAGMDAWVAGLGDLSSAKIVAYSYDARGSRISMVAYGAADAAGLGTVAEGSSTTFYTYDQAGQLLSRYNQGEVAESFVYDGMGRLVASTDAHGGTTTIVFADAALTTTVTTAAGYTSISAYNGAGELVSRTDSGTHTAGGTATYQYDSNGRLRIVTDATGRTSTMVYDKAGRLVADVNHLGEIAEYIYDQADRVIATVRYAAELDAGQMALLADPETAAELSALRPSASAADRWEWSVYDDAGRVLRHIDGEGSVAAYEYDQSDRLVRTTSFFNRLSTAQLDALKLAPPELPVDPATHAGDAVSRLFYNQAGQLVGTLDGEGYLTETVYDAAGQAVRDIAYAAATVQADRAAGDFATLRAGVAGASTVDRVGHAVYDGQGLLRFTVDARGGVTGFSYDATGKLVRNVAYATPIAASDFTYDSVKALVTANAADRASWSVYDTAGRLAYAIDAEGGVTAFAYDASGRVVKSVEYADTFDIAGGYPALGDMDGWAAAPGQANDGANRVTRNWYSERGELLYTLDAENYLHGYSYDAEGRRIGETAWPETVAASDTTTLSQLAALAAGAGSPIAFSYAYDHAGRLLTSTDGEGFVTRHTYDALGQRTDTYVAEGTADEVRNHFEYDAAGRLIAEYRAYGEPEQVGTAFAYDGLGNRIATTDANGNTTTYTHDELGRVLTVTNAANGVTAYQYDAFGNVVKITDPRGNDTYNYYDNLDRLIVSRDAEDYVTRTTYNRFGEIASSARYSDPIGEPAETGVAIFDPSEIPDDPYEYANQLQAIADGLDTQATAAEADAATAQADADAAAQAASAADTLVSDLEAQLAALLSADPTPEELALQAQIDQAIIDAAAAHAAADSAQADADAAWVAAAPLRADADTAQAAADTAQSAANAAVAAAAQAQADADALDGQATTAEADAVTSQANADTLAQAAMDADAVVTDLEDQLAALGGPVDYEALRTAALADPAPWLQARYDLLVDRKNTIGGLAQAANGYEEDLFDDYEDIARYERDYAQGLISTAQNNPSSGSVVNYINGHFDQLIWQAANPLGDDRAAALADPLTWLMNYGQLLDELIINADEQGSNPDLRDWESSLENVVEEVIKATYDISDNTYHRDSEHDWDFSNDPRFGDYFGPNATEDFDDVRSSNQHDPDYRATHIINAYFDVLDAGGADDGAAAAQLQALQDQLAQAEADATAAHAAADAAQDDADADLAASVQLRADADQAQADADTADAAAQAALATAAQAQADADALEAPAAAAEADAAQLQATADTLAQAAVDADALVANLQAQLQALQSADEQAVQAQLDQAIVDAAAAHAAADTAQAAADAAAVTAAQLRSNADLAQADADAAYAQAGTGAPISDHFVLFDLDELGSSAENLFFYDRLGRLFGTIDAEGYFEHHQYNAFGDKIAFSRHTSKAQNGIPPIGQNGELPAEIVAAYDNAAQLQAAADAIQAQIDSLAGDVAAALAAPLPYLQSHLDGLNAQLAPMNADLAAMNAELADLQDEYDNASWFEKFFILGPQIDDLEDDIADLEADIAVVQSDISALEAEIQNVQNGQGLSAFGQSIVEAEFDFDDLQDQLQQAQNAADQALADAQQMEADYLSGTGLNAATTAFEYDNRGQLTRVTDAEGYFETYGYDAYGRRISATGKSASGAVATGGLTTYTYDKRGLLLSERLPIPAQTSGGGQQTSRITNSYEYDARGNLTRRIEADGLNEERTTIYEYDGLDRLVETRHDSVSGVKIDSSTKAVVDVSGTPTETIAYDANGNVIETVDAAGAKTVFFYDELDRKVAEINALGTYTAYEHDATGNVTRIRVYDGTVNVPATGGSEDDAPDAPSGNYRDTRFTYDALGRMLTSKVMGVTTGQVSGTSWVASGDPLTTTYVYDYQGNVVRVTDPYGGRIWSYYDKLGRKTEQVDREDYLTSWTYDFHGNVKQERRYATAVSTPTSTTNPPSGDNSDDDRITQYTYDYNGNRLSEKRRDVLVHDGSGDYDTVQSTITYQYNGLGQVVRKTEATGDQTDYTYDDGGRLVEERRESFSSFNGTVTPEVDYYYDGLNNLIRTVQAGQTGIVERVTRYSYGDGGRLASMIDAEQNTHYYEYDVAGRLTLESYDRATRDMASTFDTLREGVGYRYDVLGRNIGQAYYAKPGGGWNFQSANDWSTLQYNVHGEVTRIYINRDPGDPGAFYQENKYDDAGRVWASNAGDGVWKYFGYDKNGNQTLAVTSAGEDLSDVASITIAYAMRNQAKVNATLTFYDHRDQATKVIELGRELAGSGTVDLTSRRSYNAFGEVVSETDARGSTVDYTYNTMGRLLRSESPTVYVVLDNGAGHYFRPSEDYFYDKSGRLVATRSARGIYAAGGTAANGTSKDIGTGDLTTYALLAGSGYGGTQALVTVETHADGGTVTTEYDIHGDAKNMTDEVGLVTTYVHDRLGRLTQVTGPAGLTDVYKYDVLGRRYEHYNDFFGANNKDITEYDIQGRVIGQRAFGGDVTTTDYDWSNGIANAGIGIASGGWIETTTFENGKTLVEHKDLFDRTIERTDLGGNVTDFTYDEAGRLVSSYTGNAQSSASNSYTYYNTGLVESATTTTSYQYYVNPFGGGLQIDIVEETSADYTYDKAGNRLTELGTTATTNSLGTTTSQTWKDQTATYDALGRILTWEEAGNDIAPAADIAYQYDAAGNIRHSVGNYATLDADGNVSTTQTQDYWFRYDNMGRLVIDRGVLSGDAGAAGTTIVRGGHTGTSGSLETGGNGGKEILYDQAGRRVAVITTQWVLPISSGIQYREEREIYLYDSVGRLSEVQLAVGANDADEYSVPAAPATGTKRAGYTYDTMGRLTLQQDYQADGTTVAYDRAVTYQTGSNRIASETTNTRHNDPYFPSDTDILKSVSTYNYGSGASYALGSVVSVSSVNYKNGNNGAAPDSTTSYDHVWRDGADQSAIHVTQGSQTHHTYLNYDAAGRLTSASIQDGKSRSVTYRMDENGQVIRRDETRPSNAPSGQAGSPHEVWYRFGGRELGYSGNNGTLDTDYAASIAKRQNVAPSDPGTFYGGETSGAAYADFSQSYDPINSYSQGSLGGGYTVRTGDTLQSIAQAVWGDVNLWYKIAEANGLSGNAALVEGQGLMLPTGVIQTAHNAGTFTPYDPNAAIGDLSPTTPAPPSKSGGGCGGLLKIIVAVVAVAVTAVATGGVLALATGKSLSAGLATVGIGSGTAISGVTTGGLIAVGTAGAAAGSIASQGFAVAAGIQEKFSFKGVALAALAGGIGGGLGSLIKGGGVVAGLRGAAGNLATQGIATATGLQSKFDFAGVAAAGIGGAVGRLAGKGLGVASLSRPGGLAAGNIAGRALAGTAGAIANAATRSAINGENFGDNLDRAIPDAIGQTLGEALAGALQVGGSGAVAEVEARNRQGSANPATEGGLTRNEAVESEIVVTASNRWNPLGSLGEIDYFSGVTALLADVGARNQREREEEALLIAARSDPLLRSSVNDLLRGATPAVQPGSSIGKVIGNDEVGYGELNGAGINPQSLSGFLATAAFGGASDASIVSLIGQLDGENANFFAEFRASHTSDLQLRVIGEALQRIDSDPRIAELAALVGAEQNYRWENGGRVAAELAGRAEIDILRSGVAPLETPVAGFRTFVNGEYTLENVVTLGLSGLGGIGAGLKTLRPLIADSPFIKSIHKNSLAYVGDTHVYVIRNSDGTLYKVGESAQGVRVSDGASIRAEQQARALQRETGDFYTTEIRQNFGGKAGARAYETRFIETYIKIYGKRPPGNPINR